MKVAGIVPIITITDGAITTASQCSTIMWTQAGEAITEPITGTAASGTTNTSPAVASRDRDNRDTIKDRGNRDIIKDRDNRDTIKGRDNRDIIKDRDNRDMDKDMDNSISIDTRE